MKCLVPHCREDAPDPTALRRGKEPLPFPLCRAHRERFRRAHYKHFNGRSHVGEEGKYAAWVATWTQMVDCELLNEGNGVGMQRGRWEKKGGQDVWVPEGSEPVKSSYHRPSTKQYVLPEHATKVGQAAIAIRTVEQAKLEAQLQADAAEYLRGRRMELELELKTRRLEALREAAKQLPKSKKALEATS